MVVTMSRLGIDLSPKRTADLSRSLHDVSQGRKRPEDVLEETRRLIDGVFAGNAG